MRLVTLIALTASFGTYLLNLILGASGVGSFVSDMFEMLLLLASSLFLVALFIHAEHQKNKDNPDSQ